MTGDVRDYFRRDVCRCQHEFERAGLHRGTAALAARTRCSCALQMIDVPHAALIGLPTSRPKTTVSFTSSRIYSSVDGYLFRAFMMRGCSSATGVVERMSKRSETVAAKECIALGAAGHQLVACRSMMRYRCDND